jgi:transcriptional regulator of acetoin/glycerol metabolism
MRILLDYAWPGNVRELANVIEYAVAVVRGETILPDDLPQEILHPVSGTSAGDEESGNSATSSQQLTPEQPEKRDPEARRLVAALEKHHWKRADAARELGLSRSTLWRKIRELKLG